MESSVPLLLVDDDRGLCELLADYLGGIGFGVRAAHDGPEGVRLATSGGFAIVVLDVMLPGADGFEALRQIRNHSNVPVIMLTARGDDVDRIVGLEIGADDYILKPFNPRELAARLHAILRRVRGEPSARDGARATIVVDDLEVNPAARSIRRGGKAVQLTGAEFAVLEVLVRSAGMIASRDEVSRSALGRPAEPFDRAVDMHVSHLRKKLGAAVDGGDRIRSVRGEGYIYVVCGTGGDTRTGDPMHRDSD